jgi:hypothetical protein
MITAQVFNLHGELVYELHDDSYEEYNAYDDHGNLVKKVKYKNNKCIGVKRRKLKKDSCK